MLSARTFGKRFLSILLTLLILTMMLPAEILTAAVPLGDNAIQLEYPGNISNAAIYYWRAGGWTAVTDENNTDLRTDIDYQFALTYENISVAELKAAGGRMAFALPDWFIAKDCTLDAGNATASIAAADGGILITYDAQWLEPIDESQSLLGTFTITGTVDWRKLTDMPEPIYWLGQQLGFEGELPQKYGYMELSKSEPQLISEGGNYYLKYSLTVSSKDTVTIPEVLVRDSFANSAYISEYVGVPSASLPDSAADSIQPCEARTSGHTAGSLAMDNDQMVWNIGELQPSEQRILTYCVKINNDYINGMSNNVITNTASLYAGSIFKASDSSDFHNPYNLTVEKKIESQALDNTGSGYITYTVTITSHENNSFTIEGLTLTDAVSQQLSSYVSGDSNNGTRIELTVSDGTETETKTVSYTNGSFSLPGLTLVQGQPITVTYTIRVDDLYLSANGEVDFSNTAKVINPGQDGLPDRILGETTLSTTLQSHDWITKSAEVIDKEVTVTPEGSAPFTVAKGGVKYEVTLSADGKWDLFAAMLKDSFDSGYLQYVGYARIAVLGDAAQTKWLDIDGKDSFSFIPKDIGINAGCNTYLITYYAKPVGVNDVYSATVTNCFSVSGEVTDEQGDKHTVSDVKDTAEVTIDGSREYHIEKSSWYYTPSALKTLDDSTYPPDGKDGFDNQYANGAVYWVIRIEGKIDSGANTDTGSDLKLSGSYIIDQPGGEGQKFMRDSVLGVYVGDKNFDFSKYSSFPNFLNNGASNLKKLKGNPQNDQWFPQTAVTKPEYKWFASDSKLNGLFFTEDFVKDWNNETKKADNYNCNSEAIYIILRTIPSNKPPTGMTDTRTYTNKVSVYDGSKTVDGNTASYYYQSNAQLFKESKGAYTFIDGNIKIRSPMDLNGWNPNNIHKEELTENGVYAAWLVNVNWDGSLEGTYDVLDQLPEGMELLYVDINNFGNWIKKNQSYTPRTEYIQELNNDPAWEQQVRDGITVDTFRNIVVVTYYNKEKGQLRWRISGLTKDTGYRQREINLRVICRVVDPELLLEQKKDYTNTVYLFEKTSETDLDTDKAIEILDSDQADVTIVTPVDKAVDMDKLKPNENRVADGVHILNKNEIPFVIRLNIEGISIMPNGSDLPTFIDELSKDSRFIESSLRIIVDGRDYHSFSYSIEEKDDGRQILKLDGLPDGTPITITYNVELDRPNEVINVENTAYWQDHKRPDEPQAKITALYELADTTITIKESGGQNNESFIYRISRATQDGETIEVIVSVNGGGSVTVTLPAGDYTVVEDTNWSWRYYNANTYGMDGEDWTIDQSDLTTASTTLRHENDNSIADSKTVVYEHERNDKEWLGGESHKNNHFGKLPSAGKQQQKKRPKIGAYGSCFCLYGQKKETR